MEPNEHEHEEPITDLYIQYGDIVALDAPTNVQLHEHTFFVDYVDLRQIRVIQVTSLEITTLYLTDAGQFRDESIVGVDLVSRANERGYARQSGLVPHTWVKVEFGGEYPTMVVGEITNLDEDQVEITTHPLREVLYIDFAYQGLPLDLHIVSVQSIDPPPGTSSRRQGSRSDLGPGDPITGIDDDDADMDADEHVPELSEDTADPTVRATLHQMYIDANDIVFGPDEDDVVVGQVVEISEHEKVYSVESQLNDLLDELLSTVPNAQRTTPVMARVHRLLERFRELRSQNSRFAGQHEEGRVLGPRVRTALDHAKPLLKHLGELDRSLAWLVPVVSCRRKIYDDAPDEAATDVEVLDMRSGMVDLETRQKNYALNRGSNHPNRNAYLDLQDRLTDALTPFVATGRGIPAQAQVPQEAVVDRTSVVQGTAGQVETATFVPQRFLSTPPESMHVTSWIALCRSWVEFSRVRLPTTDMLRRTSWGATWPMRFMRFARLGPRREFDTVTLALDAEAEAKRPTADAALPSTDKQYVLESEPGSAGPEADAEAFRGMVPSISDLIATLPTPTSVSLSALLARLEPFLVYGEDLTLPSYRDARTQVHTRVKALRDRMHQGRTVCQQWRNHRFPSANFSSQISLATLLGPSALTEFPHLLDHLLQGYRSLAIRDQVKTRTRQAGTGTGADVHAVSTSELWSSVWNEDGVQLLSLLLKATYVNLQIPASFYADMDASASASATDDMDALEKIKPTDCARRVLTKKYTTLGDLQKDNHEEIYADKELDDTPYGILKLYEAAQKTQTRDAFVTFLAENLVQKHGCPRNQSSELAHTLLQGKKTVRDGEYAVLSLRPQLGKENDRKDTDKNGTGIPTQDYRTRNTYYQRTRGVWVKDDTLNRGDEELAFVDSNTLFCQLQPGCVKTANVCADLSGVRDRRIPTDAARQELATRLAQSVDDVVRELDGRIEQHLRQMAHAARLRTVQQERHSNYAWTLGKHAAEVTGLVSPAAALRDTVLAETDVALRAHHVVALVDYYARTPMAEEDPHWYYCVETNTRLLPAFIHELARAFTTGGTSAMAVAMARIEQRQGVLSDDSDAIVDKHSGYAIRRIDLVVEDEFDETTGMRIPTHQVLVDRDAEGAVVASAAASAPPRTFKSPITRDIHRLYVALCYQNMGLDRSDALEDLVIRIVEAQLRSDTTHQKLDLGRKESFAVLVASTLLMGIQTSVPPFRPRKTFPGCVQSFHGFPLGGVEDMSTVTYFSCVLAVQDPALKRMRLDDRIRATLNEVLLELPEVKLRYDVRREYDAQHIPTGAGADIPAVHALSRTWRTFLPPTTAMNAEALAKTLRPVEAELANHLQDLMRRGNPEQYTVLASLVGKSIRHGYGICAGVHAVVGAQTALLQSESHVPFLQNACCSSGRQDGTTLAYFEAANPDVRKYRGVMDHVARWLETVRHATTPSVLFDPRDSRIRRTDVPLDHAFGLRSIYQAFITYGNFDRPEVPIPDDLEAIIPDKPATPDYPITGTLDEKIAAIQRAGKHYRTEQLNSLLQAVFRRRQLLRVQEDPYADAVLAAPTRPGHSGVAAPTHSGVAAPTRMVSAMVDFLDHLDLDAPTLKAFDPPLRNHLLAVLAQYQPGRMIHEDTAATTALKNYLQVANQNVRGELTDFVRANCGVKEAGELDAWLTRMTAPLSQPLLDANYLYTLTQFLRTSVTHMGEVYPSRIVAGAFSSYTVPSHWDLSVKHENDLTKVVEQYTHRLKAFVGDSMLPRVFDDVAPTCGELAQFLQYVPVHAPLFSLPPRDDSDQSGQEPVAVAFYDIFDAKTTLLLHWHVWYSVLYTYMQSVHPDGNLVRMDVKVQKTARRAAGRDDRDPMRLRAADTGSSDYVPEYADPIVDPGEDTRQEAGLHLDEIIIESDQKMLNQRVAHLIWTYVTLDRDLHQIIGETYPTIIQTFQALRDAEKRRVVNHFRDMSAEERRVEYQLKEHRLGYWNVDVQRGVVAYDKDVYDLEMQQLHEQRLRVRSDTDAADADADADADDADAYTGGGTKGTKGTKVTKGTKGRPTTHAAMSEPWDHPAEYAGLDVDDLERYDRAQVDAEYDREEHNITHYGEDYLDGNYYGGDDDDDLDFPPDD